MSPRLPSASTSRPASRAASQSPCERSPARRAEPLEAGELRLDRDAGLAGGGDHRAAVRRDCGGRLLGGAALARGTRRGGGPEPRRVGIEPEDDLRLAPLDEARQPVREARPGRRLVQGDCGCQLLTAFFSAAPALNFGDFDAAMRIFSPVRG